MKKDIRVNSSEIFTSRSIDQALERLRRIYGDDFQLTNSGNGNPFSVDMKAIRLGEILIARADLANWHMTRTTYDMVHVTVLLSGSMTCRYGDREFEMAPNSLAAVASPFEAMSHRLERGHGLGVYAPLRSLLRQAELLSGGSLPERALSEMPLQFDLSTRLGRAFIRNLKSIFAECMNLRSDGIDAVVLSGASEALLNLLVACLFPAVARVLEIAPSDVAPASIQKAYDHILAHAGERIELTRLAAELGIGIRSLQHGFREHFGQSPRDFLQECRLKRAREALLTASAAVSVTEVAFQAGFSDLSQFAARYKSKFGERPSETLRAAIRQNS